MQLISGRVNDEGQRRICENDCKNRSGHRRGLPLCDGFHIRGLNCSVGALRMKIGDLVKYKHYHACKLKEMRGVVYEIRGSGQSLHCRARVFWNNPRINDVEVMDWVDDLEVVSESR